MSLTTANIFKTADQHPYTVVMFDLETNTFYRFKSLEKFLRHLLFLLKLTHRDQLRFHAHGNLIEVNARFMVYPSCSVPYPEQDNIVVVNYLKKPLAISLYSTVREAAYYTGVNAQKVFYLTAVKNSPPENYLQFLSLRDYKLLLKDRDQFFWKDNVEEEQWHCVVYDGITYLAAGLST